MESIICVPGPWKSEAELKKGIYTAMGGVYTYENGDLINTKGEHHYRLLLTAKDPKMKEAFRAAGMVNKLDETFLSGLDKHEGVVYLYGKTGSPSAAYKMAEAATVLLLCGGIGIKVETAGIAFSMHGWASLVVEYQEQQIYGMFVHDEINAGNGWMFSCGMHNLGLKDCMIPVSEFDPSRNLITRFNLYQIFIGRPLVAGETFELPGSGKYYTISEVPEQPYKGVEHYYNPYGMWRLDLKTGTGDQGGAAGDAGSHPQPHR